MTPFTIYPHGLPSEAWLSPAPLGLEDDDITGKHRDCNNCSLRDQCNGICQFARDADREAYD